MAIIRKEIPYAREGDCRPDGIAVVNFWDKRPLACEGFTIPMPPGQSNLLFPRLSESGLIRIIGQGADDGPTAGAWQWSQDQGWSYEGPCSGSYPAIYDRQNNLYIVRPGPNVTSQGYRQLDANGNPVFSDLQMIDEFVGRTLHEYCKLLPIFVGQDKDSGIHLVMDSIRYVVEPGDTHWPHLKYDALSGIYSLSISRFDKHWVWTSTGDVFASSVVFYFFTLADVLNFPVFTAHEPPVVIPPVDPPPVTPPPVGVSMFEDPRPGFNLANVEVQNGPAGIRSWQEVDSITDVKWSTVTGKARDGAWVNWPDRISWPNVYPAGGGNGQASGDRRPPDSELDPGHPISYAVGLIYKLAGQSAKLLLINRGYLNRPGEWQPLPNLGEWGHDIFYKFGGYDWTVPDGTVFGLIAFQGSPYGMRDGQPEPNGTMHWRTGVRWVTARRQDTTDTFPDEISGGVVTPPTDPTGPTDPNVPPNNPPSGDLAAINKKLEDIFNFINAKSIPFMVKHENDGPRLSADDVKEIIKTLPATDVHIDFEGNTDPSGSSFLRHSHHFKVKL